MKWLVRIVLAVIANGLLLALAALLFDKFRLSFTGWIIGALLFTLFTVVLRGGAASLARKYASGATFAGGLALAWVSLLLTDLLTSRSNFDLEGFWTWIWTTLIVWAGAVLYDQVDDKLIDNVSGQISKQAPDAA